jgi:hypothetical protein
MNMAAPSAPTSDVPRVRARLLAEVRDAALAVDAARLAPAAQRATEAIRGVAPMTWIDAGAYIALHDEILAVGGARLLFEVSRRSVSMTTKGPLLAALVALGRKFWGNNPGMILRWLPAARSIILQGFGELVLRFVDGGAEVDVCGTPLASSEGFRVAHQGILAGLIDDAGCEGSVNINGVDDTSVTLAMRWWPRTTTAVAERPDVVLTRF